MTEHDHQHHHCSGLATILGRTAPNLLANSGAMVSPMAGMLAPHRAPKAKRAIYLFLAGSPSQFETWDQT